MLFNALLIVVVVARRPDSELMSQSRPLSSIGMYLDIGSVIDLVWRMLSV